MGTVPYLNTSAGSGDVDNYQTPVGIRIFHSGAHSGWFHLQQKVDPNPDAVWYPARTGQSAQVISDGTPTGSPGPTDSAFVWSHLEMSNIISMKIQYRAISQGKKTSDRTRVNRGSNGHCGQGGQGSPRELKRLQRLWGTLHVLDGLTTGPREAL